MRFPFLFSKVNHSKISMLTAFFLSTISVQLKPYICQQCPAKFSRKPYLDIHYRTHTGEKPFQCDICSKRFSQKSSLNIHKTIHTVQGRPFQCTVSQRTQVMFC